MDKTRLLEALERQTIPPGLTAWLRAALVKKTGVLQMPRACRTTDPKINPPGDLVLWAALLVGSDAEMILARDLLLTEELAGGSGKGSGHGLVVAACAPLVRVTGPQKQWQWVRDRLERLGAYTGAQQESADE